MEEVGDLIGRGFRVWRNNLNLCIPFLFSFALSMIALLPILAAFFYAFGPMENLDSITSEDMLAKMEGSVLVWAAAFLLSALLLTGISAFFTAAAIGMAGRALETGTASTGDMWAAGKKHFLNMFLASILSGFIVIAGMVFLLPGIALLPQPFQPEPQAMGLLITGVVLSILYALIMSLMLAVVPYALVTEDLGPVKAVRSSLGFFGYNKFDVLVLWLAVMAISLGLQMIGGAVSAGENVSFQPLSVVTGLVNVLVLSPLATVWWTRLYMSRTGKLNDCGVKSEVKNPW